jgi:hypothetical protein
MTIPALSTPFDVAVHNEAGRRTAPVTPGAPAPAYWGKDGFGFDDMLDTVNPLHHLPIVGTAYREISGDQISTGARMVGGLIFGGPIGFVLAIANAIFEEATGKDVGSAVVALLTGEEEPAPASADQLAEAAGRPAEDAAADAPAMAATQPAPAAQAAPAEATPAAGVPTLSPAAFDALVRSFDAGPAAAPAPRPEPGDRHVLAAARPPRAGMQAGAEAPAVLPPLGSLGTPRPLPERAGAADEQTDKRQAALELHQHLRAFAEQKGVRVTMKNP